MAARAFFTGLCIVFAAFLPAQDATAYFHHLTVEDGLSQGTNHFIYKDSRGFVWLSSLNGLNRYDGRRVKVYLPVPGDTSSLFGQNIQSQFFETKDQNLWFSTYEGLNTYVRKHDNFRHFVLKKDDGSQIYSYHIFHRDEQDNLWMIVDGDKLYWFHIPTERFIFQHELEMRPLRASLFTDEEGAVKRVLYYNSQIAGIFIVDYKKGTKQNTRKVFDEKAATSLFVKKMIPDGERVWLVSNKGLALYEPLTDDISFYRISISKGADNYTSLARLDVDRLLVTVSGQGMIIFNTRTRQFTERYSASPVNPHGISSNEIDQVCVDSDGGVWLSNNNRGVDYYHPSKQKFRSIRLQASLPGSPVSPDIVSLMEDREGNVWGGDRNNGIAVYNESSRSFEWMNFSRKSGMEGRFKNMIKLLADSKGRIWVLSWGGAVVWLPAEKRAFPVSNGIFLDVCELLDGKIIAAAYKGGLFEIKEKPNRQFLAEKITQVADNEPFTSLWKNSKGYLFGCKALKNICVMQPGNGFSTIQEIPVEGESSSFCEWRGDSTVWVANSYGLVRLTWDGKQYKHYVYTEKEGLPGSVVTSVIPGKDGKLWLGTGNGLSCFDPRAIHFQNFGMADGILSKQFNPFASLTRKNGEIWMGGINGITAFLPEKVKLLQVPAFPVITQILINDQNEPDLTCTSTGATNVCEIRSLQLDFQRNTISFQFAAREYSNPFGTQFMYKMEGVDPEWVNAGQGSFARYAKIPPGQYTFSVRASNSDGLWSQSRNIAIHITPPFTRTPLFYGLVAAMMLTLIWGVVQNRKNKRLLLQQQAEEKRKALESERQRIARDVHDDLGSGLSALSLMTEIARYKDTKEELKTELEKISRSSRELSGKIREVIWTVNAGNDTLASLFSYMNQYAVELLEHAEIDYQVSLPEVIPEVSISGEHRRTLFLAFKEALNNILKHAGAQKVLVDFSVNPQKLMVSVQDDGKGFDPALLVASTGNGLLNMQARMKDIHGDCQFKTSDRGTLVVFSLKLREQITNRSSNAKHPFYLKIFPNTSSR